MLKKLRGFTLIELLIVVAIIGILVALLIPNIITALQKAKQKATMKEIMTLATASADYVTDRGEAPPNGSGGDMTVEFVTSVVPFYVKALSSNDQWNNPYQVYTGALVGGQHGIPDNTATIAGDDFLIASYGRGGTEEFVYSTDDPDGGLFTVDGMEDFASDLVNWNGNWLAAPRARTN